MAYVTLTFTKKGKITVIYFSVFQFQYADDDLERSYLAGKCEGTATVFAFRPTLTYFCDCDVRLYYRSEITHISKAIMTTVKPPSKRVHYEVLLASSATTITLSL